MKKKLILFSSLIFIFCCLFALGINAAQCTNGCTDNWVIEGEGSYLDSMYARNVCPSCSTTIKEETIQPLFYTLGYSYNENGAGFVQHFSVDRQAVARYEEISGKDVKFGGVVAIRGTNDTSDPINTNGEAIIPGATSYDFTSIGYDIFDVQINGIPSEHKLGTEIVCCAYVIVDGEITYIENGEMEEKAYGNTYYDVVKSVDSWDDVTNEADGKTFKVLTIGNSFSDDAMEYLYYIAKQVYGDDVKVELGNLRYNSCSLAMHLDHAKNDKGVYMFRHWVDGASTWANTGTWNGGPYTIKEAVELTDWDYIVFQQVSDQAPNASTYDDLNALIEYVEPLNPTAKLAWHMTWSPRASNSITTYNSIVNAVNTKIVGNRKIDIIIPTGTAIQNAKTSYLADTLIQRDGKHLSYGMGRYIAALAFFKTLTGADIDNVMYPTGDTEGNSLTTGFNSAKPSFDFTDEINAICIESANNAVANPFEVTNSKYGG